MVLTKFLTKFSQCNVRRRYCLGILGIFFLVPFLMQFFNDAFIFSQDGGEDNIRYYRDVYSQEAWPGMETNISYPGEIPWTAHYHWCGEKVLRFPDYVGILSIVRVLKPQKIIFHYSKLPIIDDFWYNSWFQELKQSVPNLVLRQTPKSLECGSLDILKFALQQISKEGGVFVGEKTIVTQVPKEARTSNFHAIFGKPEDGNFNDVTRGVVYSKSGFSPEEMKSKIERVLKWKRTCLSENGKDDFKRLERNGGNGDSGDCIAMTSSFYPKDIWNSTTKFGELCRWLFYGKRDRFQVQPDSADSPLIPMITHIVWMRTDNIFKSNEFKFLHYLSVVSALNVAKFERVYIHGEALPFGPWWQELVAKHGDRVTFIKIEQPETIFQQRVRGPAHQSDVLRLNILLRHGGAYQDRDVIWVSEIPREVRRYQAVTSVDWPRNGEWPEVFNMGVMMAKPGAQWLKHFLHTFSYYRDDKWAFNAVMMPYKAYELHPDTLYVDRHLQVICFKGVCHPAWHDDYIRDIDDVTPVRPFDWRDARAFHFTVPKPPKSLSSPEEIRAGSDVYAEMGRFILGKSGRSDLL